MCGGRGLRSPHFPHDLPKFDWRAQPSVARCVGDISWGQINDLPVSLQNCLFIVIDQKEKPTIESVLMKSSERSLCCLYLHFHQIHAFVNEGWLLLAAENTVLNKWVKRKYIIICAEVLVAAFRSHCACVGFVHFTAAGEICDTWLKICCH